MSKDDERQASSAEAFTSFVGIRLLLARLTRSLLKHFLREEPVQIPGCCRCRRHLATILSARLTHRRSRVAAMQSHGVLRARIPVSRVIVTEVVLPARTVAFPGET
jgi:hypothetical protein